MAVVAVRNLRKNYGAHQAVIDVSFEIEEGETIAVLGPNGAGKTTTFEIIEGFLHRSGGEVVVLGCDPHDAGPAWRARIGMMFQSTSLDDQLTVAETIGLYAGFYPNPRRVGEVLELVGLSAEAKTRVGQLSGGQQRRVDLGVAVVGNPRLLFLDEPTTGFDPQARKQAWTTLEGLAGQGATVVLTTHYLEEARRLADRVIVLAEGRVRADGSPEQVSRMLETSSTVTFRISNPAALATYSSSGPADVELHRDEVTIRSADPVDALEKLIAWARESGERLDGLTVSPAGLEAAYLQLVEDPPRKSAVGV
jgi:ABC-2 type transport system ATP-binding protein